MFNDLISIITPCYNGHHFIADTLHSVLAQHHIRWELIIIDDHSDDSTLAVVKTIAHDDLRIRIIGLPKNAGVANARNIGLKQAKGRYIAFLDSDDVWLPSKLQSQLQFMQTTGSAISFTAFKKIDMKGEVISAKQMVPNRVTYGQLLSNNVIACSSAMYDSAQLPLATFPEIGHEDFAFWLHALKQVGEARGLNEVLLHYRVREGSVSSNKLQAAGFTWDVYRKAEGFGLFKTTLYFMAYVYHAFRKRF